MATILRFGNLASLPQAINRDEAAIGYNAYSILKTGKDEHGQSFPLNFESIGDYKMPLYIYATTLPVKLFGLNHFSIRFWSALSGVVMVAVVYLLTKKIFNSTSTALISALLLALNPWAIFYSRIAFEANLALALFLVGLYCLLEGFKKFPNFIFGLLIFTASLLTYSSSLIIVPIFLLIFTFVFKSKLKYQHLLSLFVFTLVYSTIFISLLATSSQKQAITIFSDPTTIDTYNHQRTQAVAVSPLLGRLWWNKYFYSLRTITANYAANFSPNFLLLKGGGHPWHQIPGMGYFYLMEVVMALLGGYYLLKQKKHLWLIAWLAITPLASAITIDAPHATRSLMLLPIMVILSGFGWQKLLTHWRLALVTGMLYLTQVGYFGYQYLNAYPKQITSTLPVDLKGQIETALLATDPEAPIYIDGVDESQYLYALVYSKFDPDRFQAEALWTGKDSAGLFNAYQFGRFYLTAQPTN